MTERAQRDAIRSQATLLRGDLGDYDDVVARAGQSHCVLLGEATHGTDEFYRMRAEISRRLIEEKHFDAVAVEGDWPDCHRLNRYVRGDGEDASARQSMGDFLRFPRWMWRNTVVLDFVEWLRAHNASRPREAQAGFYGMDMYSMYRSADAVVEYLDDVDHEQAMLARHQYAALDHVRDPQRYGYEAVAGLRPDCSAAVRQRLVQLMRRAEDYRKRDDPDAADAYFFAERNAYVVANAEKYYRAMFGSRAISWNLRDAHMTQTLLALQKHLQAQGREGRVIVWAHNSHIGDARATEMSLAGEYNLGQLVRQNMPTDSTFLIGFTTYTGTVMAAREWGGEAESRPVRPAVAGSCEHLFRDTGLEAFYLPLQGDVATQLEPPLLERAIGVLYLPETERTSHYFRACVPAQFDALFHLDETHAIEPLD